MKNKKLKMLLLVVLLFAVVMTLTACNKAELNPPVENSEYKVTLDTNITNAIITLKKNNYKKGDIVIVGVTVTEGYYIIDDSFFAGEIPVENKNGSYQFTMIAKDVVITLKTSSYIDDIFNSVSMITTNGNINENTSFILHTQEVNMIYDDGRLGMIEEEVTPENIFYGNYTDKDNFYSFSIKYPKSDKITLGGSMYGAFQAYLLPNSAKYFKMISPSVFEFRTELADEYISKILLLDGIDIESPIVSVPMLLLKKGMTISCEEEQITFKFAQQDFNGLPVGYFDLTYSKVGSFVIPIDPEFESCDKNIEAIFLLVGTVSVDESMRSIRIIYDENTVLSADNLEMLAQQILTEYNMVIEGYYNDALFTTEYDITKIQNNSTRIYLKLATIDNASSFTK